MIWKIFVEIITSFVPKKYRYKCRSFLRSYWNYIYVKNKAAKCGKGFRCGHGLPCSVSKQTYIEENVGINSCYVLGSGKFCIGRNTAIGPMLVVTTDNHNYQGDLLPFDNKLVVKEVIIGENCWLGANVTLLPGPKSAKALLSKLVVLYTAKFLLLR